MSSSLQPTRLRFQWQRIDPSFEGGVHKPKHEGDCGWDLSIMRGVGLEPGETKDLPINARLFLPENYWAEMKARSSIAKLGLQIDAGIIDNGYQGPLFVVCRNVSPHPVELAEGERVAQLIFHRLHELWDEEIVGEMRPPATSRGEQGFGSTGRRS